MRNTYKKPPLTYRLKTKWKKEYLLSTLLRGVLVLLPFVIIVFLLYLIFNFLFNILTPISAFLVPGLTNPHWLVNFITLIVLVAVIFLVGVVVNNKVGKTYLKYVETNLLCHIPLYTPIRDTVQQFAGIKEMPFSKVVLVDPYESGVLLTGFVTEKVTEDIYTVFVPTAPNPTNGNIYHVPASRLKFINVGPEKAMRTIVGMGTGSSCLFNLEEIEKIEGDGQGKVKKTLEADT